MILNSLIIPFIGLSAFQFNSSPKSAEQPVIPFISNANIQIDGDLADWQDLHNVFVIDKFSSPWSGPDFGKTEFKAFYDQEWFYFCFDIEDSKVVEADFKQEADVALGDRAELFITADSSLSNYYCFEIAPSGRVLDYIAHHYRKFDYSWNLKDLTIQGKKHANGYRIEVKMPMSFIKSLDNASDDPLANIKIGVFRAEFNNLNPKDPSVNWISWIRPTTEKPDFHTPSAFQSIKFQPVLKK